MRGGWREESIITEGEVQCVRIGEWGGDEIDSIGER